MFTPEYTASVSCLSITVSSAGASDTPENSHIVWKHQSSSEWNPGIAVYWSLNPILAFITIRQPIQSFVVYLQDFWKITKLHEQCESWPLPDGFALDVKVWNETRCIFHRLCGLSRLVFGFSWARLSFSACNKLLSLKAVAYVISSMTRLNVSPTPGITTTRIGSRADVDASCPCARVFWISMRRWGTELCGCNGYHSRSSPIIPGTSFCTIFTHSSTLFPNKIESGNPITTFSVSSLHIIAAATEVKVFPWPVLSATSAPSISASQTHHLTIKQMAQTWCTRNIVPGRPGIEYLWPGTHSSVDWRIRWAFSSLTVSSRHSCSILLLIVLITVLNTKQVLAGSRTFSPSSCSWTSLALWPVFFSSLMISFSCSDVSWADGLVLRHSWNVSQC